MPLKEASDIHCPKITWIQVMDISKVVQVIQGFSNYDNSSEQCSFGREHCVSTEMR